MYKYALLVLLPALALAQQDGFLEAATQFFHLIDTNNDQQLDRIEVDTYFRSFDANTDNRISRHEFTSVITQQVPWTIGHEHDLYDLFDNNGDHHLDETDFDRWFAGQDTNMDGFMTFAEFMSPQPN